MTMTKAENIELEKLVEDIPPASLDIPIPRTGLTKKRTRKLAAPHLRPHNVRGHVYYYYCRGADKEIYLGDADAILRAVKGCS